MLWLRKFTGKKWVRLLRCLDVPIMMKFVWLALSLSLVFVISPEISLRQSPNCLTERSVSAVDKDMYTWVSSAYTWWSNLWLWIRELIVQVIVVLLFGENPQAVAYSAQIKSPPPTTHRGAVRNDGAEIHGGGSLPECFTSSEGSLTSPFI